MQDFIFDFAGALLIAGVGVYFITLAILKVSDAYNWRQYNIRTRIMKEARDQFLEQYPEGEQVPAYLVHKSIDAMLYDNCVSLAHWKCCKGSHNT